MAKRITSIVLSGLLMLSMVFAFPVRADAATSLKGIVGNYDTETAGRSDHITLGSDKSATIDPAKLTLSCTVYVPFSLYKATAGGDDKGCGLDVHIDIVDHTNRRGYDMCVKAIDSKLDDEGIINYWYHFEKQDGSDVINEDAPLYAVVERVGELVKITLTDAPVDVNRDVFARVADEEFFDNAPFSKVPVGELEYNEINPWVQLSTWGIKAAGSFAVTDMEVKCDGKSVFKADTDTNEKIGTIWSHITEEETKTAPQTFNSSVKVASSKVTVKAKKKAQVKVTTLFKGDKVTVSSNKMSVATASYSAKTGKVTIVGKKAGKAVISVKTGGATKKISVTVKKKKKKK